MTFQNFITIDLLWIFYINMCTQCLVYIYHKKHWHHSAFRVCCRIMFFWCCNHKTNTICLQSLPLVGSNLNGIRLSGSLGKMFSQVAIMTPSISYIAQYNNIYKDEIDTPNRKRRQKSFKVNFNSLIQCQ